MAKYLMELVPQRLTRKVQQIRPVGMRVAMLQDLRSEISLMDNYLSEIFSVVRRKSSD